LTRRLGTDPRGPALRACVGHPAQEPVGRWCAWRGSGRRPGLQRRDAGAGRSSAGWPANGRGGRRSRRRPAAASAVGAGHRLLADARAMPLSRSYTGCYRAGGPVGKSGPAGGVLMSGAKAGSSTPAGGRPAGTAPRAGPVGGGKAADRVTVPRALRYGCRNHRRPGRPGWPVRRQSPPAQ